jgi:hypothetical protein
MRQLFVRIAQATAATAVATLALPTASGAVSAIAAAKSARVVTAPAPSRTALLINGAAVTVPPAAAGVRPGLLTTAGHGLAGSMLTLGMEGKEYEIPAAALPYLDRGLDLSLFDVSLLAARETGGRLTVRVAYQGRRPRLPGVTISSAAGGVADGYLTAASARAFGAALVRQFLADHASGSYGQDGMFAGRATISLAGTAAARAANPARAAVPGFALHTLNVTGKDLAGGPDTGDSVLVFNADNPVLFGDGYENFSTLYRGTAKFSVPDGHYWALGDFIDMSRQGKPVAERLDVLPQFTVAGDTSVHLAERAADSKIRMVTPRPSRVTATGFELRRQPRTGQTLWGYWVENGSFPLWVSPEATRVSAGKLQTYTDQWRTSPPGAGRPYNYDLAYEASGRIPRQRYLVSRRGLATIHASYYSDRRSRGGIDRYGLFRPQFSDAEQTFLPWQRASMPARRTWYLTGNPAVTWWGDMGKYVDTSFGLASFLGGQFSLARTYHPGQAVAEYWNAYPQQVGFGTRDSQFGTGVASATRAGNVLRLDVTPFSDSFGHQGAGFLTQPGLVTGSYQIDQNGHELASGRTVLHRRTPVPFWAAFNFWQASVSSRPSVIRFTLAASRARAWYPQTADLRATWTWRSAPVRSGRLPHGWECAPKPVVLDCAVQPMMTLRFGVARMALNGSAPAGRQSLHMTAGHLPLSRAARITRAAVQVSLNGGRTWRDAAVFGRAGHYTATYTTPAGSEVTLRVSASDAAGGKITETITRAYRIAR